jgi:dihydroorotate dehydrogenase
MAVDLTTDFCGLVFENPIIVAAGAHGREGETMREVSASGVAAVCTKTIVSQTATDVLPCFTKVRSGMINSVFGSDKSAEYWFGEGIKRASEVQARVIANLAGFTPEQGAELASKAEEAGADGIGCSDALGPALSIDIKTGQPTLGGPRGMGGLTGPGIMPITLRMDTCNGCGNCERVSVCPLDALEQV